MQRSKLSKHVRWIPLVAICAVSLAWACSSSDDGGGATGPTDDGGTDATVPDAVADAGKDTADPPPDQGVPDADESDAASDAPAPPEAGTDGAADAPADAPPEAAPACPEPANPAGPEVVIAAEFAPLYAAYDLGPIPGAPAGTRLGGCVVKHDDPDTLLIAVNSETPEGALYAVPVVRDACGHIVAFEGTSQQVASTPYIDANLAYGPNEVLFYTQWPQNKISQLLPGASSPASTTDLATLGVAGGGPGGLGFVPPSLAAAGELRILTWSAGYWYHLAYQPSGNVFALSSPTQSTTLPNGPGGFAYVPQGSSGFPVQSIIVAEWSADTVAVYESDAQGDPVVSTRRPFFDVFPRPWGAYFEPVAGDYLFLTWGASTADRVYVVQGFEKPPGLF